MEGTTTVVELQAKVASLEAALAFYRDKFCNDFIRPQQHTLLSFAQAEPEADNMVSSEQAVAAAVTGNPACRSTRADDNNDGTAAFGTEEHKDPDSEGFAATRVSEKDLADVLRLIPADVRILNVTWN
jgi:hypothetical protein